MFHEFEIIVWSCLASATLLRQKICESEPSEALNSQIMQILLHNAFQTNQLVTEDKNLSAKNLKSAL